MIPKTSSALRSELQLSAQYENEQQLDAIHQWCIDNVSQDVSYLGEKDQIYKKYLDLATHYLDYFIPNVGNNLDTEVTLFEQQNAIQYAAYLGYDRFIESIQSQDKTLFNKPNHNSMTPLHLAAVAGNVHTTKVLLDKGASPMQMNRNQQPPVFSALLIPILHTNDLISRKEQVFEALVKKAPEALLCHDNSGDSVYHLMASFGLSSLLIKMLNENPKIAFERNNFCHYLIHTALLNQHKSIIEALLKIDGVSELTDAKKRAPLHYAARRGELEILELCIKYARNIDALDISNKTPLMLAARANQLDVIKLLIKSGANPILADSAGHTILDFAVKEQNQAIIDWILQNTSLTRL